LTATNRAVVHFYQRGTAEQWIKEGKAATHWTRLSCHRFRANEVRLLLGVIAYNLGNLLRRLAVPLSIQSWSLTSLSEVVYWLNSYVEGNRKPSIERPAEFFRNARGGRARSLARAYPVPVSRGLTLRLSIAISRTAATLSTISRRVKPSGKMTRRRATGGVVSTGGGGSSCRQPARARTNRVRAPNAMNGHVALRPWTPRCRVLGRAHIAADMGAPCVLAPRRPASASRRAISTLEALQAAASRSLPHRH